VPSLPPGGARSRIAARQALRLRALRIQARSVSQGCVSSGAEGQRFLPMIWFIAGVAFGILVALFLFAFGAHYERVRSAFRILELEKTLRTQTELAVASLRSMQETNEALTDAVHALLDGEGAEGELTMPFVVPTKERKH
jgi:hypothetical protein